MQFLFPPLTWAFLLVLAPLLIQLINLVRQRKVEWAAMEFLLQSHKKHRTWVWLRQFLLLLLRMLAMAVVAAMLAGLVTPEDAAFFGGQATHHYLLLDDSLSMADQGSEGRAFDSALQALSNIADHLAQEPTDQKVTLLRFSRATMAWEVDTEAADLNSVTVDSGFGETMEAQKRRFDLTELAVGPGPVLELAQQLIANAAEKRRVVYLLSDFRESEWGSPSELKEGLRGLRELDADVQLIRCSPLQRQNVAITEIAPEAGTLAAGVPLLVNVEVKNFGPAVAQQVAVRVAAKSYPESVLVNLDQDVAEEQVTTVVMDEIPVGESVVRQAQLRFDRAGQHVVEARLAGDAVSADNSRRCVVEIPIAVPVLVVDGSGQNEEAFYLESIFSPGRVVTGIQPITRGVSYLRDATDEELQRYAAIYLLNVERLDGKGVSVLERFVRNGGGLAIFAGENVDPAFFNELYRSGEGLFPVPVRGPRDHIRGDLDVPDLQASDHPVFRVLVDEGGNNRPLAKRIRIHRYLGLDPDAQLDKLPAVQVLARLPSGDPLVVGRRFGDGEVIAFLTTASPTWNNWAMGPSYPVVILQLHGYLSTNNQSVQSAIAGEPIGLQLDASAYRSKAQWVMPRPTVATETSVSRRVEKAAQAVVGDSQWLTFQFGVTDGGRNGETDRTGVYVAELTSVDGKAVQRRFVANPDQRESDLRLVAMADLQSQFDDLGIEVRDVGDMQVEDAGGDGMAWSQLLAGVLVLLLLGEQLFAYSASYHPPGGDER